MHLRYTALRLFSVRGLKRGVCVAGEAVGTDEQTAVTITGVPQAAFADHNVQYQFRTDNSGGQVSAGSISSVQDFDVSADLPFRYFLVGMQQ